MRVVTLPDDLIGIQTTPVMVYDYHVQQESTKQQVNLSMNTFSFLLEGHKEVFSDIRSTSISNSEFMVMKAGKCLMTEKFAATTPIIGVSFSSSPANRSSSFQGNTASNYLKPF